jgi:phosphatidylglycerol:prolipoprotein diacylglycerol transferase
MFAAAVMVCALLASREAGRLGLAPDIIFDLTFLVVVAGLAGARLFYVVLHFSLFVDHPWDIIMIQKGGLAWQGGFVAACLAGMGFIRRKGLPLLPLLDLVAPYAALGESIGRIGCFLNGCCYGKEAAWGIFFPVHGARLHPTQLYSSIGLLMIFFLLKQYQKTTQVISLRQGWMRFRSKRPQSDADWPEGETRIRREGRIFAAYLLLASLLRFGVEFFRADHDVLLAGLSVYQWVCLGLMGAAVYVYTRLEGR